MIDPKAIWLNRSISYGLSGGLPLTILVLSLVAGFIALSYTPREEEPQIVVPVVDVEVNAPGLSSSQVERQVVVPLEKILVQIPGIEHVYSSSSSGQGVVTLRFFVGEDREEAILNTYNKLYSNQHRVPAVVDAWRVNPVEVDDVPILMLGLYSEGTESDYELKRVAQELSTLIQSVPNTSEVKVVGGRSRQVRIILDAESLVSRQTTPLDIVNSLSVSNRLVSANNLLLDQKTIQFESGDLVRNLESLENLVVNVVDGVAVTLKEVAQVSDGPAEIDSYTWIDFAASHPRGSHSGSQAVQNLPMVAISVAKQRGSNAVGVSQEVLDLLERFKQDYLPDSMHIEVLRDYGQTANEKVDNLTTSLAFAVFTVVVFIAVFLGWRPALVVGIAVPISYGITLALDMAFGYTINRVTLFALILSLGLLVDDPITGVDNIERFMRKKLKTNGGVSGRIVSAIVEIKVPLLMSTVTIMLAFIPLAFITGMMGPYMAPMAFNVPVSVAASTLVAFFVTPWLAKKLLKPQGSKAEYSAGERTHIGRSGRRSMHGLYASLLGPILDNRRMAKRLLWGVLFLFILSAMLPMLRLVPLKLLPFDNKNEVQVLIDLPDSATLEETSALARRISDELLSINEVQAIGAFVGKSSPIDFNGMVRSYYRRHAPNLADLRITLVDKAEREHQSHGVVLRMRERLKKYNANQVRVKVVEVPPGPPVMSTLVAEIYGELSTSYQHLQNAAEHVAERLSKEAHVVEVDTSVGHLQQQLRFELDKNKAALSGVSTEDSNQLLSIATTGVNAGIFQTERDVTPVPIRIEMPLSMRDEKEDLLRLQTRGRDGVVKQSSIEGIENAPSPLVALGELGEFKETWVETPIYRKDLRQVVYVTAELSGRTPAEIIADVNSDRVSEASLSKNALLENKKSEKELESAGDGKVSDWKDRNFLALFTGEATGAHWSIGDDITLNWAGEGEWLITVDVFRDMGLAFVFALIGIFVVLKIQTASVRLSLIIMSAIPLTVIGIMPGFALLNQFGEREIAGAPEPVLFTATAMIGMIALAGIVVRNSLILVEFITNEIQQDRPIREALINAGAVRMRPVLLTAGTTMLGNLVIILDPVFSGLALAIIFGIISSTLFTLFVVPVVYMLVFNKKLEEGK